MPLSSRRASGNVSSGNVSSGNVLFIILIAIALLAALTYAITGGSRGGDNLGREKTSLAVDQVAAFAADMRRAIDALSHAGLSESSISFAHTGLAAYGTPDTAPAAEVFNIKGGGASYIDVPANINDGSGWEFSAATAAPQVGDDATPDLMLVVPHVTETFCRAYNKKAGYDDGAAIPTDSSACVYDTSKRFDGTFPTSGVNTMDAATFRTPAPFACVKCADNSYNAYYVLIER